MSLSVDNSNHRFHDHCKALGSVLDIYAFTIIQDHGTDYHVSQQGVITSMRLLAKENNGSRWRISADPVPYEYAIRDGIIPEGEIISFADFLGPGYNLTTGEVELFTYYGNARGTSIMEGLAHALLDPPHGLKIMDTNENYSIECSRSERKTMTEFFNNFLNEVFLVQDVNETDHLIIYKWSDDWSNYFDAGKEWWGAFCWSVLDKKRDRITVIFASSTD